MNLETQAMTGPVTECRPHAFIVEDGPRGLVDREAGGSGTDSGERLIVAVEYAAWTWRARALAGPMDTVRVKSTQYES